MRKRELQLSGAVFLGCLQKEMEMEREMDRLRERKEGRRKKAAEPVREGDLREKQRSEKTSADALLLALHRGRGH